VKPSLSEQLAAEADAWRAAGLERELVVEEGIDFTSNDYLGLAHDPRIADAVTDACREWGAGAPGARLLHGNRPVHHQAEEEAARWMDCEAALLFPSGWQANQALLTTFADRDDVLFCDALNHASLIDGARLSRARVEVFPHNDLRALAQALARHPSARRRIIVVEEVYSMDGDRSPVNALLELCARYDAYLTLDMAHAAGLYEPQGLGSDRILARMFTGGKALGLAGAFLCGSRLVIDALINRGRSFVFTTAVPPVLAAALRRAMQIAQAEPEQAQKVFARAALLRTLLQEAGVETSGESPIVPVLVGDSRRAMAVAEKVREQGYAVRAVRPPTVPEGSSRLRIVVHATHSEDQIHGLAAAVVEAMAEEQRRAMIEEPQPTPEPQALVVCGTDTEVGKTVVSALLARAARRAGLDTCYLKPIQTGRDSDTQTVRDLAGLEEERSPDPIVQLPLPASVDQAASHAGREVHLKEVLAATRKRIASPRGAFWIVEGAGGLRVPWNTMEDQADFLQALRQPAVLVARSSLGTLNHTLLTLEALAARRIEVRALFLVGQPHPENHATLAARLPYLPLFDVPRFKTLSSEHLDFWLDTEPLLQRLFESHT
jgi:8-amino-7-oxononanoate synthase